MIDYHVHTSLCNHATGTMTQYVRAAVGKGLAGICFLDHLTFQAAGRTNAMVPREVPLYMNESAGWRGDTESRSTSGWGWRLTFHPAMWTAASRR